MFARKTTFLLCLILISRTTYAQIAEKGKPLPAWQEGYLDLHHINTGRGNCAYYIFPDGTTMLFDAGEQPYRSTYIVGTQFSNTA